MKPVKKSYLETLDRPVIQLMPAPEILIEDGIPLPKVSRPRSVWYGILAAMKPGQSASIPTRAESIKVLTVAKRLRIPVTTRKLRTGGWRVWRLSTKN